MTYEITEMIEKLSQTSVYKYPLPKYNNTCNYTHTDYINDIKIFTQDDIYHKKDLRMMIDVFLYAPIDLFYLEGFATYIKSKIKQNTVSR